MSDLDDDDLNKAADLAIMGATKNSGQRCTAVKRILVQESVADKFVELALEKAKAIKFIRPFWENCSHQEYREPFVGGGSVFIAKENVKRTWINDLDKDKDSINDLDKEEELDDEQDNLFNQDLSISQKIILDEKINQEVKKRIALNSELYMKTINKRFIYKENELKKATNEVSL